MDCRIAALQRNVWFADPARRGKLWQVAGGERLGDALSLVLLAAALAPLAVRIWSLSDEDWERWEIPLEGS